MSQLALQSAQATPTRTASGSPPASDAANAVMPMPGSPSTMTTAMSPSRSRFNGNSQSDYPPQDSPTVGRSIIYSNSAFSSLGSLPSASSPRSGRPSISSPLSANHSLAYGPTSPSPRTVTFPFRQTPSPGIRVDPAFAPKKTPVEPKATSFYSDSSDSGSPEPRSPRNALTGNPNESRTVSEPIASKPSQGSFSIPRPPPMAGPVAAAQASSSRVPPRNSSIDSAISAISAKSQAANGFQDPQNGLPDISHLIKTAGSPEALIQYLLKEKQSQSQQNTQLWRLVDKQRAMILGLNKDLERALQDKEKYRKKLKEIMAIPIVSKGASAQVDDQAKTLPVGSTIPQAQVERTRDVMGVPDSPVLDSDSQKNSPIEVTLAPYPITPPADQPNAPASAVGEVLNPTQTMPKSRDHALGKFDPEEEERAADEARKDRAEQQMKDIHYNFSLPPSRSLPSEPPSVPPPKPPTGLGLVPTVAIVDATPQPNEGLAQFPAPPPRKLPPAPLKLNKERPIVLVAAADDDTDSDFDDILEVDEFVDERRGRRRTREEDDREREIIALREAEARSASKKSKSSQPGSPREDAAPAPPVTMQEAGPASLAEMLSVPTKTREIPAPLMSPGLPASPRPFNLKAPLNSPPLSPRKGPGFPSAPLSPRPPRQPIPLPPNTPLATPAVSVAAPAVEGPSSLKMQGTNQMPTVGSAENPANRPIPAPAPTPTPSERTRVYKGLVTDEYPDLLLPPNALPSIEVKVASSRMKPSRASILSLTQLEEDPVFTLAVISRADNGELWRVEKDSASLAKLDQRLKQFASFTAKPPERSLFNGHAPAKLDARRVILEHYMDEMLNTPFDTATALEVCKYLSTHVLPPNSDDTGSMKDSASETSGSKMGPDGRPFRNGYLTKRGKNFGGWKARFFVLDGPHLKYYETPGGAHLGTIKLQSAQIGKQSQSSENQSPARSANGEDTDNQYRHAFLILEPKKKDSSSHVKHVLCAESDRERDGWVEALLQWIDYRDTDDADAPTANKPRDAHDRQGSLTHERPGTAKGKKGGHKAHGPSDSDTLIGVRYDATQAGDAPQAYARPKTSGGIPDHHGHGFDNLSAQASRLISAPKDPQVISDSSSWGSRIGLSIPSIEEKKARKRSFFGFGPKTRSSSDGQDSLFGGSDTSNATPPQNSYQGPIRQTFGVPLAEAVRYCAPTDVNVPLPAVVYRCIQYLDAKHAILEEGIFRLSGSNLVIKALRERFNTEGDVNLVTDPQYHDIHAVAGLLKLYLRELPTTILTRDLHLEFLATTEITDRVEKMAALGELVQRLPQANATLLKYLIGFLIKIINNADVNKMTVRNVGIVFSPTLNIPAPVFAMFLQNYEGIFGIDPEVYELPSPVSEPDLTHFADMPPRFDLPTRPSTSGSGSPHASLRRDPVRELRSTPTPPLIGNPNAARASPTFGARPAYEPAYSGDNNAAHAANGARPAMVEDVPEFFKEAPERAWRLTITRNHRRPDSPSPMELDPRLAAGSGDRSLTPSNAATTSQNPSPSDQLLTGHHSHERDGAETSDVTDPGLGATQHHDDPDGGDPKRPRACEACRGLKVRCEPDPNDDGPCKRCRKAGRNCVVTVPTRKRQKKTDSRVAELEKKIDALTASLQARATPMVASPVAAQRPSTEQTPPASIASAWRELSRGGQGMPIPNWGTVPPTESPILPIGIPREPARQQDHSPGVGPSPTAATPAAGQKRKFEGPEGGERQESVADSGYPTFLFPKSNRGDIVDRGLIDMEKAEEMFARYNNQMIPHLPAVVFPPGFTVAELRKTKPTLFLAIMAVATSESPVLQKTLQKELMYIFAEKVMLTGEKTVELVQAIQVAVIWYWPPEHFEELKFYQLVHIAAVMAIDIGLGQKTPLRRGKLLMDSWRVHPSRRPIPPDPTSIENRRVWLTCYFLTANTSMALHRPNLVRWTPFMAECVKILETSPDAAPTDAYFCHLVWTHRLAEEVGMQFIHEDPSVSISITDVRTQYALKGLERDLDKYRASIPADLMQRNLYMHEMALHARPIGQLQPPMMTDTLRDGLLASEPLSAGHISALSACLTAIEGLLKSFLAMDVSTVRCLPVFNFVRVAYGVVMLIKLYFSAATPGSELGRVINKEDMRAGYYLDALLDKFRATAAEDRSRPASKFLVVLVMLRSWFTKQNRGGPLTDPTQTPTPAPAATPGQQGVRTGSASEHVQTANTPLQLLSEVATGGTPGSGAGPSVPTTGEIPTHLPSFSRWSGMRQPPQPFFHDPTQTTDSTPPSGPDGTPSNMPPPPSFTSNNMQAPSADLIAAMAPGIPHPLPGVNPQSGGYASDLDFSLNAGFDLESMGLGEGSQYMYEDGVRLVLDEPWFSDMFQHMPGSGGVFNF
ncbi:hypothetical protein B0T10DRAFT_394801 [Thelonectria olida]|uniref:RhoGAP-domain-containing protein n=1 Tax=Thelonectria olida TaxID=1576542 RepID=A0A9P9AWL4_9HYPO|nr:hypothetical protein B0T10DRAFT_394801 [Thelonectria olida]